MWCKYFSLAFNRTNVSSKCILCIFILIQSWVFSNISLSSLSCDNIFRQSCIFFVYFQLSECTKQIYFENITWPYLTFLFTLRHYCSGVWRFPVDVNQRKIIQCKLNQQLKRQQLGASHTFLFISGKWQTIMTFLHDSKRILVCAF